MKRQVSRERLIELLKVGAIIELTEWGLNPTIHVRYDKEDVFLDVNRSSFLSIRKNLIPFKRETLTTYYKLMEGTKI